MKIYHTTLTLNSLAA